ncbi:hypothetical protein AGOR_G00221310 [Albula goreensis]|uniref:Globin domain-containing protein n=1 Tax=Albula goreensis TaxID=1534307 RepID=A0A8T3CHA4_9TELE|nr:hypothetical protein AGOR_G00221310 [Albula goreensis]
MVGWSSSERKIIRSVWEKINIAEVGPQALASCLIVYPWTQRYFGAFGNLSSVSAIMGNPKVAAHGMVVLAALEIAVNNMDDIKNAYAKLSELHCEKLNVDPDNFRVSEVMAQCGSIAAGGLSDHCHC